MIELSTTAALILYLAFTLTIIFTIWGKHHFQKKKRDKIDTQQQLYLCEYCQYVYLDRDNLQVSCCPQCKAYNKENLYRKP